MFVGVTALTTGPDPALNPHTVLVLNRVNDDRTKRVTLPPAASLASPRLAPFKQGLPTQERTDQSIGQDGPQLFPTAAESLVGYEQHRAFIEPQQSHAEESTTRPFEPVSQFAEGKELSEFSAELSGAE